MIFSLVLEKNMSIQEFEKELAYTFGIVDNQEILNQYMQASLAMQNAPPNTSKEQLKELMIPHFEQCYTIIQTCLQLPFEPTQAAIHEFDLFMAMQSEAHERCVEVQAQLYAYVFHTDESDFKAVSSMRVNLYKAFRSLEAEGVEELTKAQIQQFTNDAQISTNILNGFVKRAQDAVASTPVTAQFERLKLEEDEPISQEPLERNKIKKRNLR